MEIKTYGLIGFPLGHSFSRQFFNEKFKNENIAAEYRNFEIPDIRQIREIIASGVCGLNVTIPYKEQVIPFLDELDSAAEKIGSVNVIKISKDNGCIKTKGYNTDIIGFCKSIAPHIKPAHKRALVLGSGGASKAVSAGLHELGISTTFVSRSRKNGAVTYDDLTVTTMDSYQIIVNTTPLGMYPNTDSSPDIPYEGLTTGHICFDLVYNPEKTLFLQKAQERQSLTINGLEMLIEQALAAWKIWNE